MLKEGLWKERKPKAVFGLHASAHDPVGVVTYAPGPALSAADNLNIVIKGREAHGARPDLAVDPIVVASEVVMALQTIRSRSTPPLSASVVTIGMFRGGQRRNIIPGEVELQGTVRTYDPKVQDLIERRVREILDGVTKAHGATYTLEYDRRYPATLNDLALTEATLPSLRRALGADQVKKVDPQTGSEDFSFFANEVPGLLLFPGHPQGGDHLGRPPHPDLPGRRQRGARGHQGHEHRAPRLPGPRVEGQEERIDVRPVVLAPAGRAPRLR